MNIKKTIIILVVLICVGMVPMIPPANALGNHSEPLLGQITLFAFDKTPQGYLPCDGRTLPVSGNSVLYALIGNTFGGDSTAFNLPDLRQASPLAGMWYGIAVTGIWPSFDAGLGGMVVGEVCLLPDPVANRWNTPGAAWLKCDGTSYEGTAHSALYDVIGNNFGGSGSTFNVPDLSQASPLAGISYYIAAAGAPSKTVLSSDNYQGAVDLYAFTDLSPAKHELCDGNLLLISPNTALFSLLGTRFGGNGTTDFAVPDLRGAAPLPGMAYYLWKQGVYPPSS